MGEAGVQKAMAKLVDLLDRDGIPYAVIGAMALKEFGYRRVTVDVDVLRTPESLAADLLTPSLAGPLRPTPLRRGAPDGAPNPVRRYIEKFPAAAACEMPRCPPHPWFALIGCV